MQINQKGRPKNQFLVYYTQKVVQNKTQQVAHLFPRKQVNPKCVQTKSRRCEYPAPNCNPQCLKFFLENCVFSTSKRDNLAAIFLTCVSVRKKLSCTFHIRYCGTTDLCLWPRPLMNINETGPMKTKPRMAVPANWGRQCPRFPS